MHSLHDWMLLNWTCFLFLCCPLQAHGSALGSFCFMDTWGNVIFRFMIISRILPVDGSGVRGIVRSTGDIDSSALTCYTAYGIETGCTHRRLEPTTLQPVCGSFLFPSSERARLLSATLLTSLLSPFEETRRRIQAGDPESPEETEKARAEALA